VRRSPYRSTGHHARRVADEGELVPGRTGQRTSSGEMVCPFVRVIVWPRTVELDPGPPAHPTARLLHQEGPCFSWKTKPKFPALPVADGKRDQLVESSEHDPA